MAEQSFQASKSVRSGGATIVARNHSPDSVIYTHAPNFSHLSSASASVDRSSFASDAQDRDSLSVDYSQSQHILHSAGDHLCKKADKAEVHKLEDDDKVPLDVDDEVSPLVSARNSFSMALKECQERRLRSEAHTKQDLNKPALLMKKTTIAPRKSVNFSSPGTPIYRQVSEGANKGWQSERVPLQTSTNRRQQLGTALSFTNGRNLPSKWEDAERWIFSTVADDGIGRPSRLQQKKKPKARSGPLGAPGVAYYAQYSPGISMYDDSSINSLMAAAGVLMPAAMTARAGRDNAYFQKKGQPCVSRSASANGCSNLACQSSGASSQDEKVENARDEKVSRRDAATQMSPEANSQSSSRRRSSFSVSTPSILPIREVLNINSTKQNIRDVQVDERMFFSRLSKKHKSRVSGKSSEDERDWKLESHSSAWEDSDASKTLSKAQRDEEKITAWENLQKAKAEAAIRALEMKLEKKRSRSIDKIMAKVRSAEKKAQQMRSSVVANSEETQGPRNSHRGIMPWGRTWQMGSLSACFTCKAF